MDNFPSPEFTANAVKHAQKQAAQTEFHTQIVSASILASRAKSLLPLYQLRDRLDYKQALIEISLENCSRFLEIVGENPTKTQQVTAIQFFLEEERFEGYKEGVDPSGPPSMVITGYQRFIDNAVEATFFSSRRAEIPKLLHGFKHYYQSDRELGIKLGNPQAGIFSKSLAECLDNDSDLASFILAVAPNFPEDLPEMAEVKATNNSAKPTPARNGYISKVNLTFESIHYRIDVKEALIQLVLGSEATQHYFEAVRNRRDQVNVINKLIPQIGTVDEWEGNFLAKVIPVDRDVTDDFVRACEVRWKNHIDALKHRFEKIKGAYDAEKQEYEKSVNLAIMVNRSISYPILNTPFLELFSDAELAKYVFLFEPDFPEDMPDVETTWLKKITPNDLNSPQYVMDLAASPPAFNWSQPLPDISDYVFRGDPDYERAKNWYLRNRPSAKPINQLNNRERWLALCTACYPKERFPVDEGEQTRFLNKWMDHVYVTDSLLEDNYVTKEVIAGSLENAVNNLRDALHSAFQRDSGNSVSFFIEREGLWQCFSVHVEDALWRSLVRNPLASLPLPVNNQPPDTESQLPAAQPSQPAAEVKEAFPDEKIAAVNVDQVKQVIHYNLSTQTVTYQETSVFAPKVKRAKHMFFALVCEGDLHRDRLKGFIWKQGKNPGNWIKELHDTALALRTAFNTVKGGLGDELLPDALDSVYRLNREKFEILKIDD